MTGPVLYKSWSGYNVEKFSYSMASDVAKCGEYTKLSRFQGLTSKVDFAATKFGICAEESLVEYYKSRVDPVGEFRKKWKQYETTPLQYGRQDRDWETLETRGILLMREFVLEDRSGNVPIGTPEFGVVLPRDPNAPPWYNGTRLEYIADCISHGFDGDILWDIKTSGKEYPEEEDRKNYLVLDPQLLTGSLVSGIRQVGFLVLLKTKTPRVQVHVATVPEPLIVDHNNWLKEQYHKLIEHRLHRRTGVRWPNDVCLMCQFLPKCLGNEAEAAKTLRVREYDETSQFFEAIDQE